MRPDRKNVLILATCQMLYGSGRSLLIATAPVVAYALADEKALATLPTSLVIVGTALTAIPAAFVMRRLGRRMGFVLGALAGAAGGALSAYGVLQSNLWLFATGTFLFGVFAGFAQLYRFAATDAAAVDYRSTAVSLVLAGGVLAAFVGPEAAKLGKDLVGSAPFAGSYVLLIAICLLAGLVLIGLDIPRQTRVEREGPRRPLRQIVAQPVFIAATVAGAVVQGVMNFLMTATPLAMQHVHHQFDDTALVIEWHIIGMFAPGFFAGWLVTRFGEVRMIHAGIVLQIICVAVALSGQSVWQFWLANMLQGVGWCFTFTAATVLTTYAYTPAERDHTQGATNFIIYVFVALLSLSSGALVHYLGWQWVNIAALPLLFIAILVMLWYSTQPKPRLAAAK
ncbi:MAG: MFS transporter [Betaproteobacteria bacterium]|nr:MFS transporter [Betaproteobacteria bacterium]